MRIILFGPPGTGKGLISQMLEEEFKIKHIATGDLLRKEIAEKTQLGKKIKELIENGRLAPDEIMNEIIKKYLKEYKDFILDGYPRNIKQAKFLETIEKIDKVVYLNSSRNVIIGRMATRVQCSKCNRIYNLKTEEIKPKENGICDVCKSPLHVREDDIKAIKERLEVYEEETRPLINFYKKKGQLIEINGDRTPNEVYSDIRKIIK